MYAEPTLTADVWPTGTKVQLMSVPWDENYRDVVAWDAATRDAWFEAHLTDAWVSVQFTHLRPGEPVAVPVPYSSAYKYNYLAVTNPAQPVTDEGPVRTQYYFINGSTYLSPQATLLTLQLDVMTTYAGEISVGRAFVEQGHVALAEWKSLDAEGLPVKASVLDLPEGLDVGSEYVPVKRLFYNALGTSADTVPLVVIVSTADLSKDAGTVDKPVLNVASGQTADGLPSGCNVYMCKVSVFKQVMAKLQNKSWVAQCIVSIYAIPNEFVGDGKAVSMFGEGPTIYELGESPYYTGNASDIRFSIDKVGEKCTPDLGGYDPKLGIYPYSVIEISTMTGNPIYLKPQLTYSNRLDFYLVGCVLAPFAKVGLFPLQYGNPDKSVPMEASFGFVDFNGTPHAGRIPSGDFLDTAVWITDFPQFSIVNNSYVTYMASTVNTRAANYASAGWGLSRAGMVASNAYTNSMLQAETQRANEQRTTDYQWENADRTRTAAGATSAITGITSAASALPTALAGAGVGFLAGGPVGLVAGLGAGISAATQGLSAGAGYANANIQANADLENTHAQIIAATDIANRNLATAGTLAGNNRTLANSVAQGDYQNQIRGINAAVQDAALMPPSTVGQMGGNGFNWKNGFVGFMVTFKRASPAALLSCHAFFMRYGYKVQRFLDIGPVTGMVCCDKFAYWKLLETYLTCGPANESERMAMRGVFEKGVTLWKSPELIGTTDPDDNAPIAKRWWQVVSTTTVESDNA